MPDVPDNQGRITEAIKTRIIRHIHDARLSSGERLPSYDEMRVLFGCSGTSITRAMDQLMADGVVEVRRHVGAFVKDTGASTLFGRTIGIIQLGVQGSALRAFLYHYLQLELNRHGCNTILFEVPDDFRGDGDDAHLDMQRRLAYAIDHGQVQGLLDTTIQKPADYERFRRAHVPVVMIGGGQHSLPGAGLDLSAYVAEALEALFDAGCRAPALVCPEPGPDVDVFRKAYLARAARLGVAGRTVDAHGAYAGGSLARTLLALPDGRRPDGLCFMDENTTAGFTAALAEAGGGYRPKFVTTMLAPLPALFALPPLAVHAVDVRQLARTGVAMLLSEIRGEEGSRTVHIPLARMPRPVEEADGPRATLAVEETPCRA